MRALMQDWSLTLDKILDHAARWHGDQEVVTRSREGPLDRISYAGLLGRAKQVSHGLLELGVKPGDRVATMGWNTPGILRSGTARSALAQCCTP